jgi:hypothetical protein
LPLHVTSVNGERSLSAMASYFRFHASQRRIYVNSYQEAIETILDAF